MKRAIVLCGVIWVSHLSCWAQDVEPVETLSVASTEHDDHYTSYYQIEEPKAEVAFQDPIEMMALAVKELHTAAASLLSWQHETQGWPEPTDKYDRRGQFGGWFGGRGFPACQNTRAKILMRDTESQVGLSPSGCVVRTGKWHDPYTNVDYEKASEIQIDHMVPLKNAYQSGAWKWDHRTRCAYSNFQANSFHLISVEGHQNQAKGDRTPAEWLPPNSAYHCEYLKNWLSVKLIWGLIMNPDESAAIKQYVASGHCKAKDFTITKAELTAQRLAITAGTDNHCQ